MNDDDDLIGKILQEAMRNGEFDNLPGAGKPLRLDDNPNESPEWRLANHILRENGFTPPWLEERKDILAEIDQARQQFKQARAAHFQQAVELFRNRIVHINRRVLGYNLQAPTLGLHLPLLKPEDEITFLT